MQVTNVLNQAAIRSKSDGTAAKYISKAIDGALNAKTVVVYLNVIEVDTNTKIVVNWSHGVDGENWKHESTAIVDTGDDATAKVYVGDNGTTVFGSKIRVTVEIEEDSTGGGNQKQATVSVDVVLKPF